MPSYTLSKIDRKTLIRRCELISKQNWSTSEINSWLKMLHPENQQFVEQLLRETAKREAEHRAKIISEPDPTYFERSALTDWVDKPFMRQGSMQSDAEYKRALWQYVDENRW